MNVIGYEKSIKYLSNHQYFRQVKLISEMVIMNNNEKSGWFELTMKQINLISQLLRLIGAKKKRIYKYRGKLSCQYCVLMKNTIEHKNFGNVVN